MVIVRVMGGLGNQLFQYAAGRQLACRLQTTLKLDTTFYHQDDFRTYRLDAFNIDAQQATATDLALMQCFAPNYWVQKLLRLRRKFVPGYQWFFFKEEVFEPFKPAFETIAGNIYLNGYWQHEQYFANIEEIIRHEFTLKQPPVAQVRQLADTINQCMAVSLHIRRGDYISNPEVQQFHGSCNLDYYQTCIAQIVQYVDYPHFFVFSDDPDWVVDNLVIEYPVTFVTNNHDYEDLWLMSLCKHHIIANSTFSWWAAWLNLHPNKRIFAPRRWFNKPELRDLSPVPTDWIRI